MQRKYDAVIFDLDGTLLDTLDDLTDSVNAVLMQHQMRQYSRTQIRSFVGNGIRRLMQQAVPEGEANPQFAQIYEEFKAYYGVHCMDKTRPYPGILALLERLSENGYQLAIVSNKADFAVKKLRDFYFADYIKVAIGESEDIQKKPAPDTVYQALKELSTGHERAVYVGDSEVDIQTASNAGMDSIIVTWGFRDSMFLMKHGAQQEQMAACAEEVECLVKGKPTVLLK